MANVESGRVYSSYGRNSRVYVDWSIAETDSANNRWKISWEAGIVVEKNDEWYSNAVKINSIYINGGDSLGSGTYSNIKGTGTYKKLSGSKWVSANPDGSKEITVSISGWFYSYGNRSGSEKFTLPTIPRKATLISAPNFSDGENPTITYSNPAGTAVSALDACISFDGTNDHIAYRAVSKTGSSYTFTLTDAEKETLRAACQDSNTLSVQFYLRTKIGDNTYYSYIIRTFSINNANPIITALVVDTNEATIALTGDSNKLIRYYSNAQATMSAEAQKGASIDESLYIIRNGSSTGYGTSHTFENVESNVFTFSAEDSRGNVGTATVTPVMIDYIKPTCNMANTRPDASGNMTVACSGMYFNGFFGAVANTLTVQYRYKVSGGSFGSWQSMNVTKNGSSYYASANLTGLDYKQTYSFETRVTDFLETATSGNSMVKGTPIFHWGENDFVFEVPVTFKAGAEGIEDAEGDRTIDGNLNVTGNLRLKGDGNYGNTLLFGDGTYCYITEANDDEMTIKASKVHFNASGGVYVDGYPIPKLDKGTWAPTLNSAAISSYTTQYGWYMKMNQTVTVGFFIKAICNSGYDGTNISISGLPFTPMFSAAGGGMCSGAYISGGNNFQCFVAETSGKITTRIQACNNTSATNLTTSSVGCSYRSGGGELTLSGTITFMSST